MSSRHGAVVLWQGAAAFWVPRGVRRTKRDFGDLGDFATRTGVLRIGFGLCDTIKDAVDEVGTLRRGFAGLERLGGFW